MYELVSLDLWDTIIRRKCHPDAIKEATSDYLLLNYYELVSRENRSVKRLTELRVECERLIGEETRANGLDDEYEIHNVFLKWLEKALQVHDRIGQIVEELYNYELHTEIENAYLDPTIVETVEAIQYKKLAYLSDFYAGTEFIDAILNEIGCPFVFDRKYVSCESGYNKRSGRLYDYVQRDYGILPEQQFHMGDNSYSDVECPAKKGIVTQIYLPETECKLRKEKEKKYTERQEFCGLEKKEISSQSAGNISIFFYGFIRWIIESCQKDKIKKIYFFTREGEFFKQVYDEVIKNEYAMNEVPEAKLLEVSRLSTFCASLREVSLQELMRLWNQYSIQPMSALFKSLGIAKEKVQIYIDRYQIAWEEIITYPWQDKRVIKLFDDEAFLLVMQNEVTEKRELLLQYLYQKGLENDGSGKIAIVDIGWRGTIQDNISYLLPNYQIKGFYIGLIPFLNEQPQNVEKRGYLNGYDRFDYLLRYVMPFEMISNSPNGSTVGYEWKNKTVCATRKKEKEEDDVFYQYTQKIQDSVIQDLKKISEWMKTKSYVASGMRADAHKILSQYILFPQKIVTEAYFSLKHNEEFGVGEYVDKTTVLRLDLIFKAFFGRKHRSALAQFLRDTTWPQGYLVKYSLYPLLRIYNRRYANEG